MINEFNAIFLSCSIVVLHLTQKTRIKRNERTRLHPVAEPGLRSERVLTHNALHIPWCSEARL